MGIASVSPSAVETADRVNESSSRWHRLARILSTLQVGRQGSYSIERLKSLEHYCRTTSRTRVALVCLLTPLPALITAVLLECLPLRPPSEGWRANWMFLIRLSLAATILVFVGTSELITFLPNLKFTLRKRLIVSLGGSAGFMLVYFLAAEKIGFPVPYTWQTVGLSQGVLVPALILLVFGRKPFAKDSSCRKHLDRFLYFLVAFLALAATFPMYKVLYDLVPARYYACAVVLLLVGRLAAELFLVKATIELEDFVPAIIAFSVDLLASLFVSACISASPPILVSALFIGVDLGQLLFEFREATTHTNTVVEFIRMEQNPEGKSDETTHGGKLLARLVAVTQNSRAFRRTSTKGVRLWACLPHPITQDHRDQLHALEASIMYEGKDVSEERPRPKSRAAKTASVGLAPINGSIVQEKTLILEALQLLFQCEYLVLVECVECLVPLVFAIYKSILRLLPNAIYYPVGVGNWGTSAVENTLIYAALEAASLLLLHYFLQRKFAFSPLYQLPFVLETQMYIIQACLFLEFVILLQFELAHLGVDFTFRFEWLRDNY